MLYLKTEEKMNLRKLSTGFDETVRVGGIGLALFFVFLELVYINTKSLFYLDGNEGILSLTFAIVGSLAYSSTTIAVMRRQGHRNMKIILPLFDTMLVFTGYNINLFDSPEAINPMRLALSVFISLFTGIITYGLGMLNFEERSVAGEAGNSSQAVSSLTAQVNESNQVIADLTAKLDEMAEAYRKMQEREAHLSRLATGMISSWVKYESWMFKKKNESNKNAAESTISQLSLKVKQGQAVSLEEIDKIIASRS